MRRGPGGGKSAILPEGRSESGPLATPDRGHPQWTEWLSPGIASTLGRIRLLAAVRSPCQQIEAGENVRFDRISGLDGHIMSAGTPGDSTARCAATMPRRIRSLFARPLRLRALFDSVGAAA